MSDTYLAWWNGSVLPENEILISPFDRGLLYGDALFETLRADDDHIWHLALHLERLNQSADELNFQPKSFPDWGAIISDLISTNRLNGPIRIKILVTRGRAKALGLPTPEQQTAIVTTIPFEPPSDKVLKVGLNGWISSNWQTPQLAMHKTCNYLPYLCANQEALENGGEIAILTDQEHMISEATTAALVFTAGDTWIFPQSRWQLASTTAEVLSKRLEILNQSIETRSVAVDELSDFDGCWVLSSSLGARPVNLRQLGAQREDRFAVTKRINQLIYS